MEVELRIRYTHVIKKIGAIEEGVLRSHVILEDGYVRDSVIFSIIKSDWPQTKLTLESRLEKLSDNKF